MIVANIINFKIVTRQQRNWTGNCFVRSRHIANERIGK